MPIEDFTGNTWTIWGVKVSDEAVGNHILFTGTKEPRSVMLQHVESKRIHSGGTYEAGPPQVIRYDPDMTITYIASKTGANNILYTGGSENTGSWTADDSGSQGEQ